MTHYLRAVGRTVAVFTAVGLVAHTASPALGQSPASADPGTSDFPQIGLQQDSLMEVGNSLFTSSNPFGAASLDLFYDSSEDIPPGGVAPIIKSSGKHDDSSNYNWAVPAGLGFLGSYFGLSGFGSSGASTLLSNIGGSNGAGSNGAGSNGAGSNGAGSNGAGSNGAGSNGAGSNGTGSNGTGSKDTGSNGSGSNDTGSNGTGSNGTGSNGSGTVPVTSADNPAVPEPGSLALCIGLGISGTLFARRRKLVVRGS